MAHFSSVFGEGVPALPAGHLPRELLFPPQIPGRRFRCRRASEGSNRCSAAKTSGSPARQSPNAPPSPAGRKRRGALRRRLQHKRPAAGLLPQLPPKGPFGPPPGRAPPLTTPHSGGWRHRPVGRPPAPFAPAETGPPGPRQRLPPPVGSPPPLPFFIKDVALIAGLSIFFAGGGITGRFWGNALSVNKRRGKRTCSST